MKTILITGISRGIGQALAREAAARGLAVIGTSTTGSIGYDLPNATVVPLDLSKSESIAACVEKLRSRGASIDILINNAGVLLDDEMTQVYVDRLRGTLEVNLIGTIDLTEHLIPLMNREGHIVNISSSAGSLADTNPGTHSHYPYHYPAYKISKCALNMYTRTLAMRLTHEDDRGIIVSSAHPGWVRTAMGGNEAPVSPEEAARHIIDLALSHPPTGKFWFNGTEYSW